MPMLLDEVDDEEILIVNDVIDVTHLEYDVDEIEHIEITDDDEDDDSDA